MKRQPWKWSPRFRKGTTVWVFWPSLPLWYFPATGKNYREVLKGKVFGGDGVSEIFLFTPEDQLVPVMIYSGEKGLMREDEVFLDQETAERALMVLAMKGKP